MPKGRTPRDPSQKPKDDFTQRLGFVPYGQYSRALTKENMGVIKKYWRRHENLAKFGRRYPSFEMWCAMTCYQPKTDDGGEQFQKLMQLLLVGDSNFHGSHHIKPDPKKPPKKTPVEHCREFSPQIERVMQKTNSLYFHARTTKYGDVFKQDYGFEEHIEPTKANWDDCNTNGQSLSLRDSSGNYESAGGHVSAKCRPLTLDRSAKYGLFMGTVQNSFQNYNDTIGLNTSVGRTPGK
jgi:hypothetical protein